MKCNGSLVSLRLAALSAMASTASAQERIWYAESTNVGDAFGYFSVGPDRDGDGVADLLISASAATCTNQWDGWIGLYSTSGGQIYQWCGTGGATFGVGTWCDDVDGGGVPDFVTAEVAYYDPVMWGSNTGRIQVFSSETKLPIYEIVGTEPQGYFGAPVAVIGDVNNDGVRDLLVGADRYGINNEGSVFVYSATSGVLLRTHIGPVASSGLGLAVEALGDVDADGVRDYAAYASIGVNVGRLYVYSGKTGKVLLRVDGISGDNFGYEIAAAPDLDGDGVDDVIAAGTDANGHIDAYSVMTGQLIWRIDGVSTRENFGNACESISDLNGDGFDELLVTAPYDDHDGRDAGRVDVISGRSRRALHRFYSGIDGLKSYGRYLDGSTDFNGDGINDLVIGTANGGKSQAQGGHVSVFSGNDLWLQADPAQPAVTDTITVDLRGGEPGRLGLVVLTDVNGAATFAPVLLAPIDANGELQLVADADPSVSGFTFTLQGFAENRKGRGPLMVSSKAVVTVQ